MKKKKWSRPECERVMLVPEEAVLAGCKTATSLHIKQRGGLGCNGGLGGGACSAVHGS